MRIACTVAYVYGTFFLMSKSESKAEEMAVVAVPEVVPVVELFPSSLLLLRMWLLLW